MYIIYCEEWRFNSFGRVIIDKKIRHKFRSKLKQYSEEK